MVTPKKFRALEATFWSAADLIVRQTIHFAITVVLARLLVPEEFGLIALISLFIALAAVFVDGGFSSALIQRQDIGYLDECTVFWFNITVALALCAILWLLAPAIAQFYNRPILEPITQIMALNLPLSAAGAIHQALLTKRLHFDRLLVVGVVASVLSGSVGIALASKGFGVWSLVTQTLISTLIGSTLLWFVSPWRPSLVWSWNSRSRLFGFGGYMMASALISTIYGKAYTVIIGKFYSVSDLAFYSRAEGTQQLPSSVLSGILGRVFFPIFSESSHDKEQLRRGVSLAVRSAVLLNTPIMMGLAIVADPAVMVVFGPQWAPSVPILQVLCLAALLFPFHFINLNVLIAQGHSKLMFRLEIMKKAIGILLIIGGSVVGVIGVAWSVVIFSIIAFAMNTHYTARFLGYSGGRQLAETLPIFVVSLIMASGVYCVGLLLKNHMASPVQLTIQILFGLVCFASIAFGIRLRSLVEAWELLVGAKMNFRRGFATK